MVIQKGLLCNVDGQSVAGFQTCGIDAWRRGEGLVMVEVMKKPDRRPPLHAVFRRLASITLFPVSDLISLIRLVNLLSFMLRLFILIKDLMCDG